MHALVSLHLVYKLVYGFCMYRLQLGILVKSIKYTLQNLKKWAASERVSSKLVQCYICMHFRQVLALVTMAVASYAVLLFAVGGIAVGCIPCDRDGGAGAARCRARFLLLESATR